AVGWTGHSIGTRAVHIWRLTDEGGGTRVETEESMEGWFPALPLFGSLARKSLRRAVSTTVAELKREAERRHRAAPPMSEAEETLRSAYSAFNARDIEAAVALMHPEVD